MSTSQPLVEGGVWKGTRYEDGHGMSFNTTAPPNIENDTIIIGVGSPNVDKGDPAYDGWFLSDFYAFNYLLKGLGSKQVWLSAAVVTPPFVVI
jgi:hypothetical protein